jgi:hypothetical protein
MRRASAKREEWAEQAALVVVGGSQDRCFTSWFAGALDGDACAAALTTP